MNERSDRTETTRSDLLTRAKQNALAYVAAGNLPQALAAMLSDMDHLPGNTREGNDELGMVGMEYAIANDAEGLRRWIEAVP